MTDASKSKKPTAGIAGLKILSIETVIFSAPLTEPVRYGKIERLRSASVLVKITAENGGTGYGEACAVPQLTAESAESIVALIDLYVRKLVLGTDIANWRQTMDETRRRFPRSFTGLAAVETAMVDLVGKLLGVSASHLLGARYRDKIELCGSISWNQDAKAMANDAAEKSKKYSVLKVYVGPDDLTSDLQRLESVRNAISDSNRIMLDVKGLWETGTAVEVAPILKKLGVFLVEQPVAPENRDGAARVTRVYGDSFGILTAADEAIETPAQLAELSKNREFSSFNIGLTKMGGPEIAIQAAHVARALHFPVLIGSFAELGIATAAGIHLAAAMPELVAPSYLSGPARFTQTITEPQLLPKDGHVIVPDGPGLGVEVDEERVASMAS